MLKPDTSFISRALYFQQFLIGGSYVTNPETANDIDIVLHEYLHEMPGVHESLQKAGFRALEQGDAKYDEIDHKRLINVYECIHEGVKYNIIVVGAVYWPAYVGAINSMREHKEQYQTREARVNLHKGNCYIINAMLGEEDCQGI